MSKREVEDNELKDFSMASILSSFFVEVGGIVPIVGIAKLCIVFYLLQINLKLTPIILMGLITVPVYFGDRLFVDAEDKHNENKTLRNILLAKYNTFLKLSVILSFLIFEIIAFTVLSIPEAFILQTPLLVFACYPKLKEYKYLDTLAIAFAWTVELLSLALFFSNRPIQMTVFSVTFITMFGMKIAETEIGNIRDVEGDLKSGNFTFPTVYGVRKTVYMIFILSLMSCLCIIYLSQELLTDVVVSGVYVVLLSNIRKITFESIRKVIFVDRALKILLSVFMVVSVYLL